MWDMARTIGCIVGLRQSHINSFFDEKSAFLGLRADLTGAGHVPTVQTWPVPTAGRLVSAHDIIDSAAVLSASLRPPVTPQLTLTSGEQASTHHIK